MLALLFDFPAPFGAGAAGSRWVLVDASLSMEAGPEGEPTAAERARRRAAELAAAGWTVVRFGNEVGANPGASGAPDPRTLLAPALARAAEAGAREVVVLSDLRFEDGVAVEAALEELPLAVRFESEGGAVPNAGALELVVPDRPRPGEPGEARVDVHGAGAGDTLVVQVFEEDRPVAEARVPAPGPGFRRTLEVELPPTEAAGLVRYAARVRVEADAFPSDDEAVAYARVGLGEEAAVVVVSLRPDWEPRRLVPALEAVTGLPTSGYLRVGPDRFAPMGLALERGAPVDTAAVRRAAAEATILVVHGLAGDADAWARQLVGLGRRRIVFLSDAAGAQALGLRALPTRPGEWYVSPEVPPSPVAGLLAGAIHGALPPLGSMIALADEEGWQTPLVARLGGGGPARPPLLIRADEAGRTGLVLAGGFWRWAMRENGREAYRSMWAALAGWLLREQAVAGEEIRPERPVFARHEPVTWRVPPDRAGFRIRVSAGEEMVLDTAFQATGILGSGTLPPGTYRYVVSDPAGDSTAAGRFDVAATTAELLHQPADPVRLAGVADRGDEGAAAFLRRPLRTLPWPYLLIIALLCAEWIGRRRRGLR